LESLWEMWRVGRGEGSREIGESLVWWVGDGIESGVLRFVLRRRRRSVRA
jgi:hypothetical protein